MAIRTVGGPLSWGEGGDDGGDGGDGGLVNKDNDRDVEPDWSNAGGLSGLWNAEVEGLRHWRLLQQFVFKNHQDAYN